ncbi:MAG: hypothetical protein LBR38_04690, partial [Synergistaceae bacterium]|nr:hypothetical protein [Synergistaceae bacterium]
MEEAMNPAPAKKPANWHTAFVQAMRALFRPAIPDTLEFTPEFQLTNWPLRADLLIRKKRPVQLTQSIGRIFAGHNILEYKSPGDRLSVRDFHKVCAYVAQYAWKCRTRPGDLTMTLVSYGHPKGLLEYLASKWGCRMEETASGISVTKLGPMPLQVVEIGKLS